MVAAALTHVGGEGPDILLIHGFGSDRLSWSATAHALMPSRSVWAVDLPGHGNAPADAGDGHPKTLAAAVADAIGGLARPLPIVAHSLGAAVALHMAEADPGQAEALVLIAPAGLGAGVDKGFVRGLLEAETEEAMRPVLHRLVAREKLIVPAMVGHVRASLNRPGRRDALAAIAGHLDGLAPPPLPDGTPLTVIWGEDDAVNPFDPGQAALGAADLHLLPGVGHMPHMEAAAKVNRLLGRALA